MSFAIETRDLSKSYAQLRAVDHVNLRVARGEIYAFLGLNGAGKTTTIRMLLGMIRPAAGMVLLFGQAVGPHGQGPWRRVGHMVEAPSAYPELSVRENLEIARRMQAVTAVSATARVLDLLGLNAYAERKAGTLSMGNLQRLGLARALLHQPELLILDEPANGLDPAGVVEIRELLARLVRNEGLTVFMSSHILSEVDRLASRIGIIHQGRLIQELDTEQLEDLRSQRVLIKTRNLEAARTILQSAGFAVTLQDTLLVLSERAAIQAPDRLATLLVQAGVPPTQLLVEQENLEEYFLRLTHSSDHQTVSTS